MRDIILTPRTYGKVLARILESDDLAHVEVRGLATKELVNASMILRDPVDRLISNRSRRLNLAFGFAEWLGTMLGITDITFYQRFIKNYDRYSSDGATLDGAYGARLLMHGYDEGKSQFEGVIETLRGDLYSRRAVMSIYDGLDLHGGGGVNTPCTLTLQFLVRDEDEDEGEASAPKLNMIVNMRSNDLWLGLPYDLMNFTLIQEFIARQLGLDVGYYYHNAASMHLYQTDDDKVSDFVGDQQRWPYKMFEMPNLTFEDLTRMGEMVHGDDAAIKDLFVDRVELHKDSEEPDWTESSYDEADWMLQVTACMHAYAFRKSDPPHAAYALDFIEDLTLAYMTRNLVNSVKVRV